MPPHMCCPYHQATITGSARGEGPLHGSSGQSCTANKHTREQTSKQANTLTDRTIVFYPPCRHSRPAAAIRSWKVCIQDCTYGPLKVTPDADACSPPLVYLDSDETITTLRNRSVLDHGLPALLHMQPRCHHTVLPVLAASMPASSRPAG
jgi:hypothetical protein